ncbi:hypothetical protein DRP04_04485 [Archaeoglobales archaeon]|nr:MAG: hypothetical protein DRP04_04485 [Archaeoglobales archaeon]
MSKRYLILLIFVMTMFSCIHITSAEKNNPIRVDGTPDYNERIKDITIYFTKKFNITKGADIHTLFKSKSVESISARSYNIGDKKEFWVQDDWKASNKLDDDGDGQVDEFDESMYKINATLMRMGNHCYVFVEEGQSVDNNALDYIVNEFDNVVYPNVNSTFGNPPDIDNDPKITILLLDIRDANYYGLSDLFIAGYFWKLHEYPNDKLPEPYKGYSNEAEIIHIDVNPGDPSNCGSTLAHEFQHMVHFNHDIDEETWVDEGCAVYAEFICGYGHDLQKINAYCNNSDNSLTIWKDQGDDKVLADYGASYLFTLYLSEKYGDLSGNSAHEHFIRDLVDEDANGIDGINKVLSRHGYSVRFEDIFKNWLIANYLDDPTQNDPSNPLWRYDNLDIQVSITESISFNGNSNLFSDSLNQWAADYYNINITNPDEDDFYYNLSTNFWSALILVDNSGNTIVVDKEKLDRNIFIDYAKKGIIVDGENTVVIDGRKYRKLVVVVSPLDNQGGVYTLRINNMNTLLKQLTFSGGSTDTSASLDKWHTDFYKIEIQNPQADNFYYKLEYPLFQLNKDFWSALILENDTGYTVIEKSMLLLLNQTMNFTESKEYQKALREAEEKGINVSKSILPEIPPINANNTVTNAERYDRIIIIISPLDKSGDYTLKIEPIPDKHKTTNSLSQGEKAVYVVPVNVFGQPNPWNLYEHNGDVFVSLWWESPRDLDVKLSVESGKHGDVYYPEIGIDERVDVVGKSDLWPWESQVWKLEIEEKGNPSDPTIKIATNYLEGSVDDNQIFTLPTKLKITPKDMFAGSASSPTQIEFEVEIYDGNYPFSFAPYSQPKADELKNLFEVKIGGKLATILTVSGVGNKFKLTVAPPAQPSDGKYDLLVNFTFEKFGVSNTATALLDDAVEYGAGKAINVDVALVIDSSGSMSWNDPNDLRKSAAKYFVDLLGIGDWVAVVDFDEDVVVWKHLTNITSPAVKNEIKAAIDKVDSSGMTNIGGGLLYGFNELNSKQTGNRKAAILLTDGFHNTGIHPNQVVPKYKEKGWPIYTIALTGDADKDLLKWIASETGGKYIKAEKAEDLLEIYNDLKRIVKKQSTVQKVSGKLSQGESVTQSVSIDPSIRSFEVSVSWQGSDLDLYLYYPNGTRVELNASSPTGTNDPNITYVSTSTYELYTVSNPIPGTWSYEIVAKQVVGEESFTATVAATTEIMLSASTDKAEYYLNETVTITATLTNMTGGIENADVTANITQPNGYVEAIKLSDVGSGTYKVTYTNTSLAGTYSVKVEANASGVTRVAEVQFDVLSTRPQLSVTPKELDFGLSYPGDEKSVMLTIEYKDGAAAAFKAKAFENLLKELEMEETLGVTLQILKAQSSSSGLSGVIIVGDFVGPGIISAGNVRVSHPVISLPSAGKLNVTLTLNLPYSVKAGNYTSTVQVITNKGNEIVDVNLTVNKLTKLAVVDQIKNDLSKWLTAQTQAEKAYYVERVADRLVYWKYTGG